MELMQILQPCPHRSVAGDGRILCRKIQGANREVTPALCRTCPALRIGCLHLRFTLVREEGRALRIRYWTGREEVLEDRPTTVRFRTAACAHLQIPVQGPEGCARCPHRALGEGVRVLAQVRAARRWQVVGEGMGQATEGESQTVRG